MEKDLYTLLLKSFDAELKPKERQQLEEGLRLDAGLLEEKHKLEKIRTLLAEKEDDFSPFFETRVMGRIEGLAMNGWAGNLFTERLSFVFRRVALLSLGIMLALVITSWIREGSLSLETMTGISELRNDGASTFLLYGLNE